MERDDIFRAIQVAVEDTPLLMIGSGSSAPYGLPGMQELGEHLLKQLDSKYSGEKCWNTFRENLQAGQDLESALSDITFPSDILNDVKWETWSLISSRDFELFGRILFGHQELALSKLLKKLYQATPQKIDIITTNYDRVVEYACDLAQIPVANGFYGCYHKHFDKDFPLKKSVNLVKVHGSLDVFCDTHDVAVSVPMLKDRVPGLIPEIITPGASKYAAVLTGTPRQLLSAADERIGQARSFLCIGYGFNDAQIQENILTKARVGVPVVVLTKEVSDHAAHLLANNAKNYISIQEGKKKNTTEICINKEIEILDGTFWTIDGFMDIIS